MSNNQTKQSGLKGRLNATKVALYSGATSVLLAPAAFAETEAVVDFSEMIPSFSGVTDAIVTIGVALLTIAVSIKGYRIVSGLITR